MQLDLQQRAVAHEAGEHVLVTAGAGTGKTRAVVGRVLYLLGVPIEGRTIAEPVGLDRIAAITYTNAAAADLLRKLREALRAAGRRELAWQVDTARIGTIHRFCGDLLREFALRRGRHPSPVVLEEGESRALIQEAARDALIEALGAAVIPGLADLVTTRTAAKVEGFVIELLQRSDVLRRCARDPSRLGEEERVLVALATRALELHEARLEAQGAVDFDRMLVWTRDLLRDDAGARTALRRRLHTLIIDEFQDTDPVQQEIAYLIGDPLARDRETTRLLLVGDPKQSIYRFRFADVSGWRRVENDFGAGAGKVMPLAFNYRSKQPVLDLVSGAIGTALNTPIDGAALRDFEVPFAELKIGRAEQGEGPRAEALALPAMDKVEDVRTLEAEWVARRAKAFHDAGVPWSEMAVLLPAWAPAESIRDALRRQGAPVWIARDEGLLECREIVDCIVALDAVRDPEDDRALFGLLRSPFVGVRDDVLLATAEALGRTPYWPRLATGGGPEDPILRRGVALIQRLVTLRDRITVDELLADMLEQTGYLAHLSMLGDARNQAIANVRQLVRMARGFRRGGVGDFLRGIAEMRQRKDRIPEAPLHGEHENVLTIASIHTAKGLEWDVVFWCDVGRGPMRVNDKLLIGPHDIVLDSHPGWDAAKKRESEEQFAERKRMWYVAATRARRHLVVSAFATDPAKLKPEVAETWLRQPVLDAEVHTPAAQDLVVEVVAGDPPPLRDLASFTGPRPPVVVPLGRPMHSASEFLQHARCARRHWYKYVLGLREPTVPREGVDHTSAVARGQIVHDVLEHLQEEDELEALLEDAIGRWDADAPPAESSRGARYRADLRDEVARVANHPDYWAVASRPGARREIGFVRVAPGAEVFAGAIDLAAPGDDGRLVLLDVKTPQAVEAAALQAIAERYAPQRDVYVSAAEAISGADVERFAFQFSRAGRQLSEPVTGDLRTQIEASIRDRLAGMARNAPALTAFPKECGFCGYRRMGWCEGVTP